MERSLFMDIEIPHYHSIIGHIGRLSDPDIGSQGVMSVLRTLSEHTANLSDDIKDSLSETVRKIIESHFIKWLSEGDDQVYNVLDVVGVLEGGEHSPKPDLLRENWFAKRRSEFVTHAIKGHCMAVDRGNLQAVEKFELLFPEILMEKTKEKVSDTLNA